MEDKENTVAWRRTYYDFFHNYIPEGESDLQNVFTAWFLCRDIINKLEEFIGTLKNSEKTFLTTNLEFVEVLMYNYGVNDERITFVTDNPTKAKFAKVSKRYEGINVIYSDFLEYIDKVLELNRRIDELGKLNDGSSVMTKRMFDCVIMNPPYQTKSDEEDTKTQAIWPKFVDKAFHICKEDGFVVAIHPSGWRGNGAYKEIGNTIKSKQLKYLEIHNEKDGLKTFGAETRYDWYVAKNCDNSSQTIILDQDGNKISIDISNMPFIPNDDLEIVQNLIAKEGEEKVEIIADSSYHTQRDFMSKEIDSIYKYPCIYVVNSIGELQLWYSNTNIKGHFKVPKLVFSNGRISSANYFIDRNGEYGLTQFSYGIINDEENFDNIYKAMRSDRFKKVMESCSVGMLTINKDILMLFRKDFWKEFV
jgi:hypothetical protein